MNKHIGSNLDSFLVEEGLLAEVEAAALKRALAMQLERQMAKTRFSKSTLAKRMRTSRSALDRLLDPENTSVTLHTLETAALALGKRLKISLT